MKRSTRSPRVSESEFDELDRAFFDSAPPEVAVTPAPVTRFDDLDDGVPVPARVRAARAKRQGRAEARAEALSAWTSRLGGAKGRVSAWLGGVARAVARDAATGLATARGWGGQRLERATLWLERGWPSARARFASRARETLARLAEQIPGERLDGKTLAATIAVVIVIGLSAGVFAQRPASSAAELASSPASSAGAR
jgi:hypothetical protein